MNSNTVSSTFPSAKLRNVVKSFLSVLWYPLLRPDETLGLPLWGEKKFWHYDYGFKQNKTKT